MRSPKSSAPRTLCSSNWVSCPRWSATQSGTWLTATLSSRDRAAPFGSAARSKPGRSRRRLRLGGDRGRGPVPGLERDSPLVELVYRRLMANRDDGRAGQRFDDRAIEIGLALLVEGGR